MTNNWTCDQIESRLSDYLDGLLQKPERAAFDAHIASCADCGPLLASVSGLVGELHQMEELQAPPRLMYAILDKTLGPRKSVTGWQALLGFLRGLASPKFAYGTASVMATMFIVLSASGFSFRKPKLADLRPANLYRTANRQVHLAYAHSVKYVGDLRVVYEIQSRLRSDQNDLQATPDESLPKTTPQKGPGQTDDQKPNQPKQQNRADELNRNVQLLAFAECPAIFERSFR
jgi:hypothetical protein